MMNDCTNSESVMKMLLTSPIQPGLPSHSPTKMSFTSQNIVSLSNTQMTDDDSSSKFITYFHQSAGEKEVDPILMDHCYSRPWNWRPESSYIRPTKTLFIPKTNGTKHNTTLPLQINSEESDIIDVETVPVTPVPIYDTEKAKTLMEECDKHAAYARASDGNDDWEETISKVNWTTSQNQLFLSMTKILNSIHMSKLAYSGSWNEPILRRAVIDKAVDRTRSLMASIAWDVRLTQWLHNLLLENLSTQYLSSYLDILQTLKSKLPTFVEKMMFGTGSVNRVGIMSNESLFPLLKRPWDPVASSLMHDKPKKLPGNPIIIVAPSAPTVTASLPKRVHKMVNLLSHLAHVVTVNAHIGSTGTRMTMVNCADQMLNAMRAKIQEVRTEYPNRPLVLVGFNTGSSIVCQVAEVEHVVAVVCVGFPLMTMEGKRGESDDILLELQCPVLFVIGQNSHKTSCEEMEDLRERMRVETGLVVVGCADDQIRVSKTKRRTEGITQSIVDRCVLDEIGEFVGSILSCPYPRQSYPPAGTYIINDQMSSKRLKVERVRNNSNGSSVESEPPSPQPKLNRPVGRPPGSGKKKYYQNLQGSPPVPTISNSSLTDTNPDLNTGLTFLSKPESFRSSNNPEILNRAVQSITPTTTQPISLSGNVNRSLFTTGSTLSNLLQGGQRTIPTTSIARSSTPATNIKVLENTVISPSTATRVLSSGGRTLDLSKITLLNSSVSNSGKSANIGNVMILPDGTKCVRSTGSNNLTTIKTFGNSPLLPIVSNKSQIQKPSVTSPGIAKLVQSKRQIITKPRLPTSLPPTPLTTADIMDLPIIFADSDSPLLTENTDDMSKVVLPVKKPTGNKMVIINKQIPCTGQTSSPNIQQNILKRSLQTSNMRTNLQPVKYAKIIVSKRDDKPLLTNQKLKTSQELVTISSKKYDQFCGESVDLESELKATTVPKPMHATIMNSVGKTELKHFKRINADGKSTNVTVRVPVSVARSLNPVMRVEPTDNTLLLNRGMNRRIVTDMKFTEDQDIDK